jgi:hypothetical protein
MLNSSSKARRVALPYPLRVKFVTSENYVRGLSVLVLGAVSQCLGDTCSTVHHCWLVKS